jgi:hypothetical protein
MMAAESNNLSVVIAASALIATFLIPETSKRSLHATGVASSKSDVSAG